MTWKWDKLADYIFEYVNKYGVPKSEDEFLGILVRAEKELGGGYDFKLLHYEYFSYMGSTFTAIIREEVSWTLLYISGLEWSPGKINIRLEVYRLYKEYKRLAR